MAIAGATTALLAALLGAAADDGPKPPVRITCPVHQTTTVVFPEPLRQLRSPGRPASLALAVRSTRPRGVITVRPTAHPAQGTVEFRGPTMTLRVLLETAAEGAASEVHLGPDGALLVPPAPPAPSVEAAAPPAAMPPPVTAPPPTTPPAPAAPPAALDMEGLLRATPVSIERKEGRPGQRPMVLVDALHGEEWIWLRFRLDGGAAERVEEVSWEQGAITRFVQEVSGRDLRVVVQVPRAPVTRKTRITVRLAGGAAYRFSLSSSTLTNFVKELFK